MAKSKSHTENQRINAERVMLAEQRKAQQQFLRNNFVLAHREDDSKLVVIGGIVRVDQMIEVGG
jgi:hypothetical protein